MELHGLGYLEKIKKNSFRNNAFDNQLRFIKPGEGLTIFDVGANNGSVTEKYARLYPGAQIHSFEPIPELITLFEQRNGHNNRIALNKLALSNVNGEQTLHLNKSLDTSSLLVSSNIGGSSDALCQTVSTISIQTITLDQYCADRNINQIDILKMDTQGSELNILKGAERMLRENRIKLIFSEVYFKPQYQQQPLFNELIAYLRPFGIELQDIYETIYNDKQLLWGDAIFVHHSLLA